MVNPHEAWAKNWRSRRDKNLTDEAVDHVTDMTKDVIRIQMLPCKECGGMIGCMPGKPPESCANHQ